MLGEQRLVRGNDVLARVESCEHEFARDARSPDELDYEVDRRVIDDLAPVARELIIAKRYAAVALEIDVGNPRELE